MFASIATNLASVAASHLLKSIAPQNQNSAGEVNIPDGNYNIRGHVNNVPVDLRVEKGAKSATYTSRETFAGNGYEKIQQNQLLTRTKSASSKTNRSTCSNCNSVSNNRKPNQANKFCSVTIPQEGNFEVRIRKTESSFAKMNLSNSNATQNTQKQNTPNQNFNKQKQQNGNQNTPNRNQSGGAKSQNDGPKQRQNKINRKPEELKKFAKNSFGAQNSGPNNQGRNNMRVSSNNQSTWMYLGRLKVGTTEFDIKNYLKEKFPNYDFWVEALPMYKDAKLPCFKVRVDNRILNDFQNPINWPKGTTIKTFIKNFKN